METIKQLYYDKAECFDNMPGIPETAEAEKLFNGWAKSLDWADYLNAEEILTALENSYETQGFIKGFSYAMQLLQECNVGTVNFQ